MSGTKKESNKRTGRVERRLHRRGERDEKGDVTGKGGREREMSMFSDTESIRFWKYLLMQREL